MPDGSGPMILGVMGGVGGSVTLLSYGYWIREKGWEGSRFTSIVRIDLIVAYVLTGLFGVAVVILAGRTLYGGEPLAGSGAATQMATMLEPVLGRAGRWTFLVGFWGAVATSMLGVWQGVPYLFADFLRLVRKTESATGKDSPADLSRTPSYRVFLGYLAVAPLVLLAFDKPVFLVVVYSIIGAFFIPFLAATLLYLNGKARWLGSLRNGPLTVISLLACLALFGYIAFRELARVAETIWVFLGTTG